eukprot:3640479-Amphidinium_carterae.1
MVSDLCNPANWCSIGRASSEETYMERHIALDPKQLMYDSDSVHSSNAHTALLNEQASSSVHLLIGYASPRLIEHACCADGHTKDRKPPALNHGEKVDTWPAQEECMTRLEEPEQVASTIRTKPITKKNPPRQKKVAIINSAHKNDCR